MNKFIIMGDYESVVIYKLLGWDVEIVNLNDKILILEKFNNIINKNYERIFVIEEIYELLEKEYKNFEKLKVPIIPLSGIRGTKNIAKQKYKNLTTIATSIKLKD